MNRIAFIIRGVSGSGKSTLAKSLAALNPDHCICEADAYFYDPSGDYVFRPESLGQAHNYCKNLFVQALNRGTQLVICSNTNTSRKEYQFYIDEAEKRGYTVHVVIAERFKDTKSVHNVPQETLDRQAEKLRQSIQF
jgi:predicted ABC-type ATPase